MQDQVSVIGILGGMGPEATAELFYRIIKASPAQYDQQHLRIIIDNNPKIPDRTQAILGKGPSPLPMIVETAHNLERAGADVLVMPCNTAHYYYDALTQRIELPVLHMIELTSTVITKDFPDVQQVGLIATTGTVRTQLYDHALRRHNVKVLYPPEAAQIRVMTAIYEKIKGGNLEEGKQILVTVAETLIDRGTDLVICGCTEASLVLKHGDLSVPISDPLQILAEVAVATALGQ